MLNTLNTMDRAEHGKLSSSIVERILEMDEFSNASTIGVTISRFPEVDTRLLIEMAWQAGKRVAVPRCIRATRGMDFRLIESYEQLETVYMDLLEPIVNETNAVDKDDIDLLIVPGVVYSQEGYRIGFGGGYYDRYLTNYQGCTLSMAFECQMDHTIPIEQHDVPVTQIITEQRVICCLENEDI